MSVASVIYKWPGQQHWNYVEGNFVDAGNEAKGFMVTPFNGPPKLILPAKTKTFSEFPSSVFSDMIGCSQDWYTFEPVYSMQLYKEALNKSIEAINSGELKKVIISRMEYYASTDELFVERFPLLANAYSNAFVYFLVTEKCGSWFGASPEILAEETDISFTTMALAGTIKSEMEIEMKDWKQKEIEEQKYVADYIAALFEKNSLGFDRSPTSIQRTGNIHHLVSRFVLPKSQKINLIGLANMLHPTPAICGLPVDASRKFILENEKYDRKLYTGYLGPVGMEGDNGFFVNLRCGQKIAGGAFLYAGGGINKGSVAEDELVETINKMENTWRFFS
jgi:isochorismate synthase